MRMKVIKALRAAGSCLGRLLDVRMPMGEVYGLRTR